MPYEYIHANICRCPVCVLIAKKVTIMGVRINFTMPTPLMLVHVSPRNIAYQDDIEVKNALIDLVMDYHLQHDIKVGECTFRSGGGQEHFIIRQKRNEYTICFHTLPAGGGDIAPAAEEEDEIDPVPTD